MDFGARVFDLPVPGGPLLIMAPDRSRRRSAIALS